MDRSNYPALYLDADDSSNNFQTKFLWLVRGEYAALIFASMLTVNPFGGVSYHFIYAALFFTGLVLLIVRAQSEPDQWWYRCRALAESVKTLTWRYMMHAAPFNRNEAESQITLQNELHEMFKQNVETAKKITNNWSGNHQITEMMETVRKLPRAKRMDFYLTHRVDEQRNWYKKKSSINRNCTRCWVRAGVAIYIVAGLLVLTRIVFPDWLYWPVEPLIVVASSIIGWMQIKKFNELAAAYTVAAHEIGLIRPRATRANTAEQFSEFVNDAEKAFSREHTLWIARQSD